VKNYREGAPGGRRAFVPDPPTDKGRTHGNLLVGKGQKVTIMGEKTGVWALDVDTPEDHEDGATAWNDITSQHPPIKTREHRSATDGPFFAIICPLL
jgi:hypothetical protein